MTVMEQAGTATADSRVAGIMQRAVGRENRRKTVTE